MVKKKWAQRYKWLRNDVTSNWLHPWC